MLTSRRRAFSKRCSCRTCTFGYHNRGRRGNPRHRYHAINSKAVRRVFRAWIRRGEEAWQSEPTPIFYLGYTD